MRATFDSAPDGLVVHGGDGSVLVCNARFLQLWDLPGDRIEQLSIAPQQLHEHIAGRLEDPAAYWQCLAPQAAGGETDAAATLRLLDGRVLERRASPLGEVHGVSLPPGGSVVRWREVTLQKQAESALAGAQARLGALFEHALNAILMADDSQRYIDANPAACELLGYGRDEIVGGLRVVDVLVPGSLDLSDRWGRFVGSGRQRGRVQLRRKDGGIVSAQFSAVAHVLPGVHLSVMSDMTEEDRALQQHREIATLLDLALVAADLAFWDIDLATGLVNSVSERWYAMLGYTPGEVDNNLPAWMDLIHADDRDARLAAWEAHLNGSSPRYEAEFRTRHKAGHWVWLRERGQAVARGADGLVTRLVGTRQDISQHKRAEQLLHEMAHTDELTGIHNRRRFFELGQQEMARACRHGHPVALLMIDLDHFKAVNDEHGHPGGDQVLRAFVRTARTVMRQSDVFARVGGEEFAALLPYANSEGAQTIADRLLRQIRASLVQLDSGVTVRYSVSVGVAVIDSPAADSAAATQADAAELVNALVRTADHALYTAKSMGRDRVVLVQH